MGTLQIDKGVAQKKAWTKIIVGLFLVIAGSVGIVFGKSVKQKFLRITILILSVFCLGAGAYLFVDGTTDLAIGLLGNYQLDGPPVQSMKFPGPNFFELSLVPLRSQSPNLRRLRYECLDGSKKFTVFITRFGIFGIPKESVICDDGFKLIDYDPSSGFVHSLPISELKK